jgi:hypothetical protein
VTFLGDGVWFECPRDRVHEIIIIIIMLKLKFALEQATKAQRGVEV